MKTDHAATMASILNTRGWEVEADDDLVEQAVTAAESGRRDALARALMGNGQLGEALDDADAVLAFWETANTTHAFVSDMTPSRATVEAVGDEEDLRARFEDRSDGRIIEVPAGTEAGERVWL